MRYILMLLLLLGMPFTGTAKETWTTPIAFSQLDWMTRFIKYELQHRLTAEQKWETNFVDIQSSYDYDTELYKICGILEAKDGDLWFFALAYKDSHVRSLIAVDDTAKTICTKEGYVPSIPKS